MTNVCSMLNTGEKLVSDMQVLFSAVFAFSVNLLQLVILEVLEALDYRFAYGSQQMLAHVSALHACAT